MNVLISESDLADDFKAILFDLSLEIAQEIKYNVTYRYPSGMNEVPKSFRLILGKPSFIEKNNPGFDIIPVSFVLRQNYPNPFNSSTIISYTLPAKSKVSLIIFDLLGKHIKTLVSGQSQDPGNHFVQWNGENEYNASVSSGVYIYRLYSNNQMLSNKMLLIR